MKRLGLAIASPLLLFVLLAGAWSLATGRAARMLWSRPPVAPVTGVPAESALATSGGAAGVATRGSYQLHPDPRVGYALRPSTSLRMGAITVVSDALGLRRRSGPPPAVAARTIAVVGDSVAFGQGVADDACLAARLEATLAAARGDVAAPSLIARTVAIPGWNWRNSTTFLLDHWDELRPSFVVFIPIENDLADTEGLAERGRRRLVPDVASVDPWLTISMTRIHERLIPLVARVEAGELALSDEEVGPIALNCDLGGESTRRFDAMADGLVAWTVELERRGARVAIAPYVDQPFTAFLVERLLLRRPDLPIVPLLRQAGPADVQEGDAHPNATTVATLACWLARSLAAELRWFDVAAPLEQPPESFAARRAEPRTREEWSALAGAARSAAEAALVPRIAPGRGPGVNQVLGGLAPNGAMGPHLLAPRPGRSAATPLMVTVALDGAVVGKLELPAGAIATVRGQFAVPSRAGAVPVAPPSIEVKLVADRFVAVAEPGGYDVAACLLELLAVVDD